METIEKLKKQQEELEQKSKKIEKKINNILKQTALICKKCQHGFEIGSLTYLQTHWYKEPYRCIGGDRWYKGEGNWKCPNCSFINRLYDKPDIEKLRYLFKDIKDVYDK